MYNDFEMFTGLALCGDGVDIGDDYHYCGVGDGDDSEDYLRRSLPEATNLTHLFCG